MRITILTAYFPPEMGAPPARLSEIADRLKGFGHDVTVVTAFPSRPLGRIYDGYRGKFRTCVEEAGIRVIRTWIRPSASSASFLSRTINDLSFAWSSGWTTAKLLGRQDVLIVQNPPIFSIISALHLARKTGAQIAMWCGDVWPDVLLQSGQLQPGLTARMMRRLQQHGFRRSGLLALTTPAIVAEIRKAYDCPPVTVWSNGIDTQVFRPELRDENLRVRFGAGENDILVGYVGLHGRFQGLEAIVDAADVLRDDPRFRFVLVGEGVDKPRLVEKAKTLGLDRIQFVAPMPKAEMPGLVASCDVAVVSLLTRMPGTMPSKFYEALAAGTIPLTADGCEAAPLVRKYRVGFLYEPGDGKSAAEALLSVCRMGADERQEMRRRARELSLRFDRGKLAQHVNSCLVALTENKPLPEIEW